MIYLQALVIVLLICFIIYYRRRRRKRLEWAIKATLIHQTTVASAAHMEVIRSAIMAPHFKKLAMVHCVLDQTRAVVDILKSKPLDN